MKTADGKPRVKVLEGIKPFNKFLFKSCYYHQIIAGYSYFGVDERVTLVNYLPVYCANGAECVPDVKDMPLFDDKDIADITGVRLTVKAGSGSILNEAVGNIARNRPVIVAVDTYDLPYREDAYKKIHSQHYILLYGYDLDAMEFVASEHFYLNSTLYRETRIGFAVLERAFAGNMEQFASKNKRVVVIMSRAKRADAGNRRGIVDGNTESKANDIRITFKKDVSRDLSESMAVLREKGAELSDIISDPKALESRAQDILEFLSVVRAKKQGQRNYFADASGKDSEIAALLDRVRENYLFLFGCIVKMKLTGRYADGRLLAAAKGRLSEIIEKEERVHMHLAAYYAPGNEIWIR
jgi:hypothetical protein